MVWYIVIISLAARGFPSSFLFTCPLSQCTWSHFAGTAGQTGETGFLLKATRRNASGFHGQTGKCEGWLSIRVRSSNWSARARGRERSASNLALARSARSVLPTLFLTVDAYGSSIYCQRKCFAGSSKISPAP